MSDKVGKVQFYESGFPFEELAERGVRIVLLTELPDWVPEKDHEAWLATFKHLLGDRAIEYIGLAYVEGCMAQVWADGKTPAELGLKAPAPPDA